MVLFSVLAESLTLIAASRFLDTHTLAANSQAGAVFAFVLGIDEFWGRFLSRLLQSSLPILPGEMDCPLAHLEWSARVFSTGWERKRLLIFSGCSTFDVMMKFDSNIYVQRSSKCTFPGKYMNLSYHLTTARYLDFTISRQVASGFAIFMTISSSRIEMCSTSTLQCFQLEFVQLIIATK
ncbi:hypothetical protein B0H13DRAFT_2352803 [Mycena leptocephala]|nr:hypothetical protein B0H13DRAFT_2352803 [Mycena leptocephala]